MSHDLHNTNYTSSLCDVTLGVSDLLCLAPYFRSKVDNENCAKIDIMVYIKTSSSDSSHSLITMDCHYLLQQRALQGHILKAGHQVAVGLDTKLFPLIVLATKTLH